MQIQFVSLQTLNHSEACSSALASGEDGTTSGALAKIGTSGKDVCSSIAIDSVVSTTEGSSRAVFGYSSGALGSVY